MNKWPLKTDFRQGGAGRGGGGAELYHRDGGGMTFLLRRPSPVHIDIIILQSSDIGLDASEIS